MQHNVPISADFAVCLDGLFLMFTFFQAFSVKDCSATQDRTRAARSTGRRANHCATAESYEVVLKLDYLSKILIFKNGPSKQTKEVAWFSREMFRFGPYWNENYFTLCPLHKMFTLCINNSAVCCYEPCIHCLCLSFIWNLGEILTLWKSWLGSILEEKRTKKEIQLRALIKPYLKLDTWTGSIKRGQTFIHPYSWDVFMMPEVCDHVAYSECEEPLLYYGENV